MGPRVKGGNILFTPTRSTSQVEIVKYINIYIPSLCPVKYILNDTSTGGKVKKRQLDFTMKL